MPILKFNKKKEIKRTTFDEFYSAAIKVAPITSFDRAGWLAFYLETKKAAEKYCKSEWKECPDCGQVHFIRTDGFSTHPSVTTNIKDRKNWSNQVVVPTPLGNEERLQANTIKEDRAKTLRSMIR
jgi:hypothetical protein